ncbi:hypothetical protein BV380_30495, partial [Klebsiella pneumoniae]
SKMGRSRQELHDGLPGPFAVVAAAWGGDGVVLASAGGCMTDDAVGVAGADLSQFGPRRRVGRHHGLLLLMYN